MVGHESKAFLAARDFVGKPPVCAVDEGDDDTSDGIPAFGPSPAHAYTRRPDPCR